MKRFFTVVLSLILCLAFCAAFVQDAQAAENGSARSRRTRRNAYQKANVPIGWDWEAGYALWRLQNKQPTNRHTYKMYKIDRRWHDRMHRYYRPQELLLDTADWTVEELARFLDRNKEYIRFYPAGLEN